MGHMEVAAAPYEQQDDVINAVARRLAILDRMSKKQRRDAGKPTAGQDRSAASDLFAQAVQHHQAGRLDKAAELYRRVLTLEPAHADCLHLFGMAAFQAGHAEAALQLLRQAVAVKTDYFEAFANLGNMLFGMGRLEEAATCYRKATSLQAGFALAHFNLANTLQAQGKLEDAIASFSQAIALDPSHADAHFNLGNALKALGREEQAVSSYQRAFALRTGTTPAKSDELSSGSTTLFLELTNKCNFHCDFCPSDSQTRNIGFMDFDLVKNVLDEAARKRLVKNLDLHLMGEPTLHPRFLDIAAYAATLSLKLELVTNGSPFTAKMIPLFLDVFSGSLVVSLQTPNEASYHLRGKTGLSWDRYIEGIRALARERIKRTLTGGCRAEIEIRVMVTKDSDLCVDIVGSNEEAVSIYKEWSDFAASVERDLGLTPFPRCKPDQGLEMLSKEGGSATKFTLQHGVSLVFWQAFTFANSRARADADLCAKETAVFCPRPFEDVGVLWNGDVTLCCLDYDGKLTVGNVKNSPLEAILASPEATRLRASMRGQSPLHPFCAACQARPKGAA
jgi:tetratricopeptide (TPR) repeat protein